MKNYTREELSSLMGVSWLTVYKYLDRGEFNHIRKVKKKGRYYFYQNISDDDLKRLHELIHMHLRCHYL